MDTRTAKNIGRLWIAITNAMPSQARDLARDVILDVIDDPDTTPEDREYWRIVLGLETVEERRQAIRLIS